MNVSLSEGQGPGSWACASNMFASMIHASWMHAPCIHASYKVADMEMAKVADKVADMEVDKLADVVDDMEVDKVPDMEVVSSSQAGPKGRQLEVGLGGPLDF